MDRRKQNLVFPFLGLLLGALIVLLVAPRAEALIAPTNCIQKPLVVGKYRITSIQSTDCKTAKTAAVQLAKRASAGKLSTGKRVAVGKYLCPPFLKGAKIKKTAFTCYSSQGYFIVTLQRRG
jgi:hypothetical protein